MEVRSRTGYQDGSRVRCDARSLKRTLECVPCERSMGGKGTSKKKLEVYDLGYQQPYKNVKT
jgi:hypothetical protein